MCIRDRVDVVEPRGCLQQRSHGDDVIVAARKGIFLIVYGCLLYTSDAADERSSVDLGGRRIIKKKKVVIYQESRYTDGIA